MLCCKLPQQVVSCVGWKAGCVSRSQGRQLTQVLGGRAASCAQRNLSLASTACIALHALHCMHCVAPLMLGARPCCKLKFDARSTVQCFVHQAAHPLHGGLCMLCSADFRSKTSLVLKPNSLVLYRAWSLPRQRTLLLLHKASHPRRCAHQGSTLVWLKPDVCNAVQGSVYQGNTPPAWWPLPVWDNKQLHTKAACVKAS